MGQALSKGCSGSSRWRRGSTGVADSICVVRVFFSSRNPKSKIKKKKSKARRRLRWRRRSLDLQIHLFKSKGNPASSLFHWSWRSVLSSLARSQLPASFDPPILLQSSIHIGSLPFQNDEKQSSPKPLRIVPILTRYVFQVRSDFGNFFRVF